MFAFLVYSQRCGGKNAFQFPELIATSPLKKEGTIANEEAWQKSQGICSISFPLEENGRGPGVTPTPKVMAAERSPRAASMSTTQPLI